MLRTISETPEEAENSREDSIFRTEECDTAPQHGLFAKSRWDKEDHAAQLIAAASRDANRARLSHLLRHIDKKTE